MIQKAGIGAFLIAAVFSLLFGSASRVLAGSETMYDYSKIPPFIETGLDPNLLLLIDNSASMYDAAYRNPDGDNVCYARGDEDLDGDGLHPATEDNNGNGVYDKNYDGTTAYEGYFDTDDSSWYKYDSVESEFVSATDAGTFCSDATGTKYTADDLCLTIDTSTDPDSVTAFAAKGRFLNWLMSSKFDVEKKILTGGKYDGTNSQMILESRGCNESTFIKDIPVVKVSDGTHNVATFGVRPPTEAEKTADGVYNSSISNTRLDIYKVTDTGMIFAHCQSAIEQFGLPGQQFKNDILACLDPTGTGLFDSRAAFNQTMQECAFYRQHGTWQSGSSIQALKNACEDVYNVPNNTRVELPYAGYVSPGSLSPSDICYGNYVTPGPHSSYPWGSGYLGQCWETQSTWEGNDVIVYQNVPCAGYNFPADGSQRCVADYVYYCNGNYNSNTGACNGNPGTWAKLSIAYPITGGDWVSTVGWTDDNAADSQPGDTCAEEALHSYCQGIDEQTTVDPSDYTDSEGDIAGLPALLVDNASKAQLGDPLVSLKGLVQASSIPTGLIQEFKYNLRIGAMKFNAGVSPVTDSSLGTVECQPVLRSDGTYRASLYDCLQAKGTAITSSTTAIEPDMKDGGKIISYIDDGNTHITELVSAINNVSATAWTPIAEAYMEAIGYYTQRSELRLNDDDFVCNQDYDISTYPVWEPGSLILKATRSAMIGASAKGENYT